MTTVTSRNLTFFDDGQTVIVPAGTECVVFNRVVHASIVEQADGLLTEARVRNALAGKFTHLVMVIGGRPRLLEQAWVETARTETPKPPPVPAPKTEAPVKPSRQPSLF